jgi:hypothetical protein
VPAKIRSTAQIDQDRALIAEYHLKGWTQKAISEKLAIPVSTVRYDLNRIEDDWRKSSVFDFDLSKQRNLADINLLEREAWAAWEGSKAPRERTRTRSARRSGPSLDPSGRKSSADALQATVSSAEKSTEQRDPDPRYMAVIQWCIDARAKLLGQYAPVGVHVQHGGTIRQVSEIVYELPANVPVAGLTMIGGGSQSPQPSLQAPESETSEFDLAG